MFLHDLKSYKRILGTLVFVFGIFLIFASVYTGNSLISDIQTNGLITFIKTKGKYGNYVFTIFSAGFPIGAGISVIGAAILSDANRKRVWWYAWILILATVIISLIPVIFGKHHSHKYFEMSGNIIIVLFLLFSWFWSRNRHKLDTKSQIAADLKMAGYFFFLLATWELFLLLGLPYYLLYPGHVIEFNTLPFAVSQAKLVMTLFIVGWVFTVIGYLYNNQVSLWKILKKKEGS